MKMDNSSFIHFVFHYIDEVYAGIIRDYQEALQQCLQHQAPMLIRELTQFKVLTQEDREKIRDTPQNERVTEILKLLQNMNKQDFEKFLIILSKMEQEELSQILREAADCLWDQENKGKKDEKNMLQRLKDCYKKVKKYVKGKEYCNNF